MSVKRPPLEYVIDIRGDRRVKHKTSGPIRYAPCNCKQRKGYCCDNRYCVCVQRGIYCGPKCNDGQCCNSGNCTNCIPAELLEVEEEVVVQSGEMKEQETLHKKMDDAQFEAEWQSIIQSVDSDSIFKLDW